MRRILVASAVVVGLLPICAAAAAQESRTRSGWWSVTSGAGSPDVPEKGLLVQGGPDAAAPTAYAAMSSSMAGGRRPAWLVVNVAPNTATTPGSRLVVCPLTTLFEPAYGGPAASGPRFDCSTSSTAGPSADGMSYRFDLSALISDGSVTVAILPATATDRVVLTAPGPGAIETVDEVSGDAVVEANPDGAGTTFDFTPSAPSASSWVPVPSAVEIADLPESALSRTPSTAQVPMPSAMVAPSAATSDDSRAVAPFILAVLTFAAIALWALAGHTAEHRELGDPV